MGIAVGVAGVLSRKIRQRHIDTDKSLERSLALRHFRASSLWPVPRDYEGQSWTIRNEYPRRGSAQQQPPRGRVTSGSSPDGPKDMPWSIVDFKDNPLAFCETIRQYCWEGNVENRFVVQKNRVRVLVLRPLEILKCMLNTTNNFSGQRLVSRPMVTLHKPREGAS